MGIFSKSDGATGDSPAEKKNGWYQRYQDRKRGEPISDDELQKHLGMTREQLKEWSENRPGVGKNQLASKAGISSGLGGMAVADGYGGWGRDGYQNDDKRGMKFPPQQPAEKQTPKGNSDGAQ